MPVLAGCAWAGGLVGLELTPWWVGGAVGLVVVLAGSAYLRGWRTRGLVTAGALLLAAAAGLAALAQGRVAGGPVAALAADGAFVTARVVTTSDPRAVAGGQRPGEPVEPRIVVRATTTELTGRGATYRVRAPVLLLAPDDWGDVRLGTAVQVRGVLAAGEDEVAAFLRTGEEPTVLSEPRWWWRGAEVVRGSLRASVAERPEHQRALVPALVVGDDAGLDPALAADFRTTGLTHLLAVSGTNLTLLVGFLLVAARWAGVRGRGLPVVAALGIAGFVVLARAEPSVVRAAAMGTVGLIGLGTRGRERGSRGLGVAVVVLVLLDPHLAATPGFALSVLATAGIVFLAPRWRDALATWMPRPLAEALAVPATAQLACTPVVAALSGEVSLVAVLANLLVAPAVGPATVLGLAGGLVGLVWPWAGQLAGTLAGWCVAWLVVVAQRGAALPTPAVPWGDQAVSLAVLTALCALGVVVAPFVLGSRVAVLGCVVAVAVAVVVRPPTPGWPPPGWLMVACDVGQGDALALNAGDRSAVVVDAGPDPAAADRCLSDLDVERIPLLVVSHFHADHVDGLPGLVRDREVGELIVTGLGEPEGGSQLVSGVARELGLVPRLAEAGKTRSVGRVALQTLWPPAQVRRLGDAGSVENNVSVVLLAEVAGVRMLLTGDVEPEAQAAIARAWPGLESQVVKVPHHGSRFQDFPFLESLGSRVALVSVGAENDYGHPAEELLSGLAGSGAEVLRTDLQGDLAVVLRSGELATVARGAG